MTNLKYIKEMKDINIQLNELQDFLDFVNERDKQLWNKYLRQ